MNAGIGSIASAAGVSIKYALIGALSRTFYKKVRDMYGSETIRSTYESKPNANMALFNTPSEAIKAAQRLAPQTNFDIARVTIEETPGKVEIVEGLDGDGEFVLEVQGYDGFRYYLVGRPWEVTDHLSEARKYSSVNAALEGARVDTHGRKVLDIFRVVKTAPKVEYSFEVLK